MIDKKIKLGSFMLSSVLSLGSFSTAYASGFALIEVNASGQGNAYAGASAHTNNASTIFFNPAGMMNLQGEQLSFATHAIDPSADFDNDGSALPAVLGPLGGPLTGDDDDGGETAFVANFYWVKPINDDMSFGIGVNTPFGLKTEYDDDWVGRYHGILSDLKTLNFNPSLGYRVNDNLSIGGGLNVMLAKVHLTNAIDFGSFCLAAAGAGTCVPGGATPQDADGKADLEGDNYDDLGVGFNVGLTYMISKQTTIGVAYRSEVDINVEGDADFRLPDNPTVQGVVGMTPLFVDTDLKADVTLPASFSVSLAHQVNKFTWLTDITWTGWSSFDELRIEYDNPAQPDSVTTEDWDDTMRYSVGLDYQYSDTLILRTGLAFDETPVPNAEKRTPRLPGNDRTWVSLGLTYIASSAISFDVGYSHLFIDDAKIDNTLESSVPTLNSTLTGEYDADVDIISAQLNWNID
jgi:long-chain fatty acid transport protein